MLGVVKQEWHNVLLSAVCGWFMVVLWYWSTLFFFFFVEFTWSLANKATLMNDPRLVKQRVSEEGRYQWKWREGRKLKHKFQTKTNKKEAEGEEFEQKSTMKIQISCLEGWLLNDRMKGVWKEVDEGEGGNRNEDGNGVGGHCSFEERERGRERESKRAINRRWIDRARDRHTGWSILFVWLFGLVVRFGCSVWLFDLVVRFGCSIWLFGLVVRFGCSVWLFDLVVRFGCSIWLLVVGLTEGRPVFRVCLVWFFFFEWFFLCVFYFLGDFTLQSK